MHIIAKVKKSTGSRNKDHSHATSKMSEKAEEVADKRASVESAASKNLFDPIASEIHVRQLGQQALRFLNNGEPISDEVIVQIVVEKIKSLNNSRGWILDGFPLTLNQAKLLEKALTGFDEDKPVVERIKKESVLAPNPNPKEEKKQHKPGLDLVLFLDMDDQIVIKRSVGRYSKHGILFII